MARALLFTQARLFVSGLAASATPEKTGRKNRMRKLSTLFVAALLDPDGEALLSLIHKELVA